MTKIDLIKVRARLKNELERSVQGKVNLIGVMAGILGLILASVGGFLAFESATLSQVRMFEEVSEAEDFATMQYRLKTNLTRIDPISVP